MKSSTWADQIDANAEQIVASLLAINKAPDHLGNVLINSPLREDRNPSFSINVRTGQWVDFARSNDRDGKGDLIRLAALMWGLDERNDFARICQQLAQLAGFELQDTKHAPADRAPRPPAPKPSPAAAAAPSPMPKIVLTRPVTRDELACEYGLEWADFAKAGFKACRKGFARTGWEDIDAVMYPIGYHDGRAGMKFKSFQREITPHEKANRKRLQMVNSPGRGSNDTLTGIIGMDHLKATQRKTLVLAGGEEKMLAARKAGYLSICLQTGEKSPTGQQMKMLLEAAPSSIVIAYDNDKTGRDSAEAAADAIIQAGIPIVRVCVWRPGLAAGYDLNDLLKESGLEGVRELIEVAPVYEPEVTRNAAGVTTYDPSAAIMINDEYSKICDQCIDAMANKAMDQVFRYNGFLSRISPPEYEAGTTKMLRAPQIQPLASSSLRVLLSEVSVFVKRSTRETMVKVGCPRDIAEMVLSLSDERYGRLRRLQAVETTPIMRADGSICTTPGYDQASESLLYIDDKWPTVPTLVTPAMMVESRDRLCRLVQDFPFKTEQDRSAWFAGLLTVIGRRLIQGNVPAFVMRGNVKGTGKSKLIDMYGWIKNGMDVPEKSMPPSTDEKEWANLKVCLALERQWGVKLDNLRGTIDCPQLEAILTGNCMVNERILGGNKMLNTRLECVWFMTGNNLRMGADLSRRVVVCDLESQLESPSKRDTFAIDPIDAYVKERRRQFFTDAMTMMAYGVQEERRPTPPLKPRFGSFEEWSQVVRKTLLHCGMKDPMDRIGSMDIDVEDEERGQIIAFIEAILHLERNGMSGGVTTLALVERAGTEVEYAKDPNAAIVKPLVDLGSILAQWPGARKGLLPPPSRVNQKLEGWQNRNVRGKKIVRVHGSSIAWKVVDA